jgi:hypothetical protein
VTVAASTDEPDQEPVVILIKRSGSNVDRVGQILLADWPDCAAELTLRSDRKIQSPSRAPFSNNHWSEECRQVTGRLRVQEGNQTSPKRSRLSQLTLPGDECPPALTGKGLHRRAVATTFPLRFSCQKLEFVAGTTFP